MALRPGDTGDGVKILQRGLNKLGFLLVVDGQFGAGTQGAVLAAGGYSASRCLPTPTIR